VIAATVEIVFAVLKRDSLVLFGSSGSFGEITLRLRKLVEQLDLSHVYPRAFLIPSPKGVMRNAGRWRRISVISK
jgi:hypothetical protein